MSFWTNNTTEPKRNFRWRVTLSAVSGENIIGGVVWWAKSVGSPAYTVTETPHQFFDNEYYFPGRVKWEPVSMTLVDPISPNAVQLTNQIILDSGYSLKGHQEFAGAIPNRFGVNGPSSITKSSANTATGDVMIEIFSGKGEIVEKWNLSNPFITSVKFSDLSYDNDDMRTIDMTWRYDWATCTHLDAKYGDKIQFPRPGEN